MTSFTFSCGPDRRPFVPYLDTAGTRPFHGIIPLGVLRAVEAGTLPRTVWPELAPLLDGTRSTVDAPMDEHVRSLGVLSFADSAACAAAYLSAGRIDDRVTRPIELWGVKEGHKASIWLVMPPVTPGGDPPEPACVLSVARDLEAAEAVIETANRMREIARADTEANMVRVEDIDLVPVAGGVTAVVRATFAPGLELHPFVDADGTRTYVAVERFETADDDPARIVRLRGRRLTSGEVDVVDRDVARFRRIASSCAPADVAIERGDVVWDGQRAIVVDIQ